MIDAAAAAGLEPILVVVPPDGSIADDAVAPGIALVNVRPEDGLSSSVRIGIGALLPTEDTDAVVILPGDQPLVRPEAIRAVLAGLDDAHPIAIPRYDDDTNPNPVALARVAWPLVAELSGDRGFGPLIHDRPELVATVELAGANPDIDTVADLVGIAEADWAARVRANREQVERVREVPDGADFYAPVSSIFRADPARAGDPVLDALVALAVPGETWLDIGAGAGRYALPLARVAREVIAVDPSSSMLDGLGEGMAEAGLTNIRPIQARWPLDPELEAAVGPLPIADVALIAHVSYDVEEIGPFLDRMEAAARRLCVAVLMDRAPASRADAFWPTVHGEARSPLPALAELRGLLEARGRVVEEQLVDQEPRTFASREQLLGFLRRQLWVEPDGAKDRALQAALDRLVEPQPSGGVRLAGGEPLRVGILAWVP